MPKMNYKLSKEAQNDLEQIWLYTLENWSIDQADRYFNLLIDEMEYLCLKPNSGFNFSYIRTGYWRTKVKSHFIFYRINQANQLEIIRVLHERMDVENQM
jgi:toxin ParE1/3/4